MSKMLVLAKIGYLWVPPLSKDRLEKRNNYGRNVKYSQKEKVYSLYKKDRSFLVFWEACQVDEEIRIDGRNYWGTNCNSI